MLKNRAQDIKIIVPDTRINDAERALRDRAFPLCTNPHCRELLANRDPVDTSHFHEVLAWNKRHLVAQSHFHLQPERSRIIVSLHKQSDVLPWMPELTVSPPPPNHPHLVLSNDASRLPRAWPSPQAVQTLNPDSFCEGLLRLFCRDYGMPDKPHLLWWRMMINAIGDFDDPVRILPARFQLAWDHLMERRDEEVNVLLEVLRLRKRFIDDGELTGDSLPVVDLAEFEKPV
ncbi:hypothetical protein BDV19DRAFT_28987 [Aspergillus venezuelensis]